MSRSEDLSTLPAGWRWTYSSKLHMVVEVVAVVVVAYLGRVAYNHFTGDPDPWTGTAFLAPLIFGALAVIALWLNHPSRHRADDERPGAAGGG